jgi:phage tail-like protein
MNYNFNTPANTDLKKLVNVAAYTLDELKAYIDQFVDNFDIERVDPKNISIISNLLGYPFSNETEIEFKRRLLRTAIDFYKAKGTADSIKILFYTLGLNVDVVPLWTADFKDFVEITPPYVQAEITLVEADITGAYKDVTIINPDEQLYTASAAIRL